MNSKRTFNVYRATPLYQPNDAGDILAFSTDNSRFAELAIASLQQCSGNKFIKLCRQCFSTTTDETLLCLPSLYFIYDKPGLRNCNIESVFLPDAPQVFPLADGSYILSLATLTYR